MAAAPSHPATTQGHAHTLSPPFRMGDTLAQVERALHVHPLVKVNTGEPAIWYTWYSFFLDPTALAVGLRALYTVQTDGKGVQSRVIKIVYQPPDGSLRGKPPMADQCFALGPADAQPVPNHGEDVLIGWGEYFNFESASLASEVAPDAWRTGNPGEPSRPGTTNLRPIFDASSQDIIGCMWSLGTV